MQGLSKYSDVFLRHEIDLKMFSYLTEDELKEIGINAFGKLYEKDKFLVLENFFFQVLRGKIWGLLSSPIRFIFWSKMDSVYSPLPFHLQFV